MNDHDDHYDADDGDEDGEDNEDWHLVISKQSLDEGVSWSLKSVQQWE